MVCYSSRCPAGRRATISNLGLAAKGSRSVRRRLDDFWELIDEILNAVLFLLIGVEVLLLTFSGKYFVAGLIAIPSMSHIVTDSDDAIRLFLRAIPFNF